MQGQTFPGSCTAVKGQSQYAMAIGKKTALPWISEFVQFFNMA